MRVGARNTIADVAGLRVGNAEDAALRSGCTVVVGDRPFVAGVSVMGGAPGTRETDLLAPERLVQEVDALVLSGGSAFGLDACSGVTDGLRAAGRGFRVGPALVPLVPGAILFDLLNGGDKDWLENPYRALGRAAFESASANFDLGTVGAGTGAMTAMHKGGLGSASLVLESGVTVGALVAANPVGSVTTPGERHFWAAPFERNNEFGGRGQPAAVSLQALNFRTKGQPGENTTLVVVATDATLTKAQTRRLAIMAQDGLSRALRPIHTPLDGDIVFAAATCQRPFADPIYGLAELGTLAADVVARAIARGVYEARALPFPGALPSWRDKFGK